MHRRRHVELASPLACFGLELVGVWGKQGWGVWGKQGEMVRVILDIHQTGRRVRYFIATLTPQVHCRCNEARRADNDCRQARCIVVATRPDGLIMIVDMLGAFSLQRGRTG